MDKTQPAGTSRRGESEGGGTGWEEEEKSAGRSLFVLQVLEGKCGERRGGANRFYHDWIEVDLNYSCCRLITHLDVTFVTIQENKPLLVLFEVQLSADHTSLFLGVFCQRTSDNLSCALS